MIPIVKAPELNEPFTPRELEVVSVLAGGHSSRIAGRMLGVSPRTVETHRERIYRKLAVTSIAGVTAYALKNNFVIP